MSRILAAMSGGVDSAVAALLLHEAGEDVTGVYMKNWINEEQVVGDCPWQQDIADAADAANAIGIPFEVVNFMKDYRERVVRYLIDGYRRGITPNPDVMCNRQIKFGVLLDWARERGFNAVATGHYAIRREIPEGGHAIHEGVDKNKDQSYFLAQLQPHQVAGARFPIGHLQKPEVRRIARRAGLPNADKKDSQGICFIGEVRINDFLEAFIPDSPGEIVDAAGSVLGEHRGLHRFTLGQRKGIGIPSNTDHAFYVVVAKDYESNRLIVDFEGPRAPGLYRDTCTLDALNWIGEPVDGAATLLARPRYRDPAVPAEFTPVSPGRAAIRFHRAQRALAPGQVCALYRGDRLLGGGVFGSPDFLPPQPAGNCGKVASGSS